MAEITIHIDKADVENMLAEKINGLSSHLTNLLDDISDNVEYAERDESPVRLGDLQNSHVTEIVGSFERWVGPTVDHAIFVVEETRPHPINSPVLIEGNWVYIKDHPGTKANDYISRAATRAESSNNMLIGNFVSWITS